MAEDRRACEWTVRPVGVVSVIACGPPPGSGPSASKAGRLDPDGEPRGLHVEVVALTDPEAIARGGGSAVCCGEGMVDLADGGIAPRDAADLVAQLDEASQPTRVHALSGDHGDQVASVCPGPFPLDDIEQVFDVVKGSGRDGGPRALDCRRRRG